MADKFLVKNPIITEKASRLSAHGQYLFLVKKNATKPEIKKSIEAGWKVKVDRVNIVNIKPKARRLGRTMGQKPGYKKAIVTLRAGEKLDILPQAQ
ncbi:MAG: 50S ribosomal protein L23 [Candidatus Harrisonbacteria bacterium CG10_big_fil_rev_8_21_14_0_10_44_23]|uniref:Large ribosomal subunit protein uL23 n=1 Tax=Candidatus Harrisonbacteria bacterium CG10_big_fil_rev_8_21_14_0_10_44_23 TaxID=1974585 RepID=A0A2H0USD6_9BACT|nr:MAG: 50S ribosomal protein L23 [Candidatus Harrisonbacteria bacterium CG10_big_fil_rev_8_21_14_0_10_44_23]